MKNQVILHQVYIDRVLDIHIVILEKKPVIRKQKFSVIFSTPTTLY